MKNLKHFLMERDVQTIIQKTQDVPEDVIRKVYDYLGDKYNKFTAPISRLFHKKDSNYDLSNLPELMGKLTSLKKGIDPYSFDDFEQLEKFVDQQYQEQETEKSRYIKTNSGEKVDLQHELAKDMPLVFEAGDWKVYELKSWEAAKYFTPGHCEDESLNMGWCTGWKSSSNYFDSYSSSGRIFPIAYKGKWVLQYFKANENSGKSDEIQRPHNKSTSVEEVLDRAPELMPFFKSVGYQREMAFQFLGRSFKFTLDREANQFVFDEISINHQPEFTSPMQFPWVGIEDPTAWVEENFPDAA